MRLTLRARTRPGAVNEANEDQVGANPQGFPAEGAPSPGEMAAAPPEPAAGAASKNRLAAAAMRFGYPIALALVAILYVFWPNDLAPDRKWYGGADDVVFIVLLAYLARRVIRGSPALLDLPGVISRAVRRALRLRA